MDVLLRQQRLNFLKKHIILNEARSSLISLHQQKLPSSQATLIQSGQFRLDAIDTMNSFAYLAPGIEPCQFPAGITDVDIKTFIESDSLTQTQFAQLKQFLQKKMVDSLQKKIAEIQRIHPYAPRRNRSIAQSLEEISTTINQAHQISRQFPHHLLQINDNHHALAIQLIEVLVHILQKVVLITQNFKLNRHIKFNEVTFVFNHYSQAFFQSTATSIAVSSSMIEYVTKEFELGTYDKDRVKALSVIQRHISAEANRLAKEKASMQHSLQVYRQIGMGFPVLVQEYSNLLRQLEQQRWTLQQIAPQ
ncbi:hypothetical protein BLNAU_12688 [Blattamonas nauphoetae]|uniref:Uncharacterized protein n=1 Tax=Blattamonas nauphoetae TaxID=2049346 RepID=A0ABQ9XK92_9EUKA|nr:hypothetical protein BLNAU_12688 [Blattamonas nauphoetae]